MRSLSAHRFASDLAFRVGRQPSGPAAGKEDDHVVGVGEVARARAGAELGESCQQRRSSRRIHHGVTRRPVVAARRQTCHQRRGTGVCPERTDELAVARDRVGSRRSAPAAPRRRCPRPRSGRATDALQPASSSESVHRPEGVEGRPAPCARGARAPQRACREQVVELYEFPVRPDVIPVRFRSTRSRTAFRVVTMGAAVKQVDGITFDVGREVRVAHRHLHRAVSEQLLDDLERHAADCQVARK